MWLSFLLLLFSIGASPKAYFDYTYLKSNFMGKVLSEVTNQGFPVYITNVYDEEGVEICMIKLFLATNDYIVLWSYPVSNETQIITAIDIYTPKVYIYGDIHINSDLKDLLNKNVNFIISTNKKNNLIQWAMDTNSRAVFYFYNKRLKDKISQIRLFLE